MAVDMVVEAVAVRGITRATATELETEQAETPTEQPEAQTPPRVDPEVARRFGDFFMGYRGDLQAVAFRLLENWHQAEDAVGEVARKALPHWAALLRHTDTLTPDRGEEEQRRYMYSCVQRQCMDVLRRRKLAPDRPLSLDWMGSAESEDSLVDLLDLAPTLVSGADEVSQTVLVREELAEVRALASDRQWATLVLQEAGYTLAEIADLLAETSLAGTPGGLRVGLHRLRRVVRERLGATDETDQTDTTTPGGTDDATEGVA